MEKNQEIKFYGYTKKKNKVCILGTASTLVYTPWNDQSYDFWACAPVITNEHGKGKKFDLLFEMHPAEYWCQKDIIERLNKQDTLTFMQSKVPQIKKSLTYPLGDVQSMVTTTRFKRYFTSTISYMIALAIKMGYERIDLYGVHMAASEEYGDQRQACEAWIAFGDALGINIFIPEESEIMKNGCLYGYEQMNDVVVKLRHRRQGLQNGLKQLEEKLTNLQKQFDEQNGAIRDCEYWERLLK